MIVELSIWPIILITIVLFVLTFLLLRKKEGKSENLDPKSLVERSIKDSAIVFLDTITQKLAEMSTNIRDNNDKNFASNREEMSNAFEKLRDSLSFKLGNLTKSNSEELEQTRETIRKNMQELQKDNREELERIRGTVDEKLQKSLDERISQSFSKVNKTLADLHEKFGEMREISTNVVDLGKLFSNVKQRGEIGEQRLGSLIEDFLSPEQFKKNVAIPENSNSTVEYAILLPSGDKKALLPIDAKFSKEKYERLLSAREEGDKDGIKKAQKEFKSDLMSQAKKITKYIHPPYTIDYAIMFLPSEGLYSEAASLPDFFDEAWRNHHIMLCGPMNLGAMIASFKHFFKMARFTELQTSAFEIFAKVEKQLGNVIMKLIDSEKSIDKSSKLVGEAKRNVEKMSRSIEALQLKNHDTDPSKQIAKGNDPNLSKVETNSTNQLFDE